MYDQDSGFTHFIILFWKNARMGARGRCIFPEPIHVPSGRTFYGGRRALRCLPRSRGADSATGLASRHQAACLGPETLFRRNVYVTDASSSSLGHSQDRCRWDSNLAGPQTSLEAFEKDRFRLLPIPLPLVSGLSCIHYGHVAKSGQSKDRLIAFPCHSTQESADSPCMQS